MREQIVDVRVPLTALEKRISERMREQIADVPVLPSDAPGDQVCRYSADSAHRQGGRGAGGEATVLGCVKDGVDDVPVPQILNEIVEEGKAQKIVPWERISERICEQIDDNLVPVDQRGDQACRGHATTVPSYSNFAEDGGSPDGAVCRQSGGCARDRADHAVCAQGDRGARERTQATQFPSLFGATSSTGQAGLASMSRQTAAEPGHLGAMVSTSRGPMTTRWSCGSTVCAART